MSGSFHQERKRREETTRVGATVDVNDGGPNPAPDTPARSDRAANASRSPNDAEHGALAPHFRLLVLGGGNRPVESGAQLLGRLQRQLNPRPRAGVEVGVD